MPNVSHASLTGANLHEPKGVATASSGDVYVADGGGSGDWKQGGGHVYGNIYSKDGSIAISTIGTTAKKFAVFTANGPSNGMTSDHTNDQITVLTAGVYKVHGVFSIATAAAGDAGLYQLHLRVNGTEDSSVGIRHYFSGSSDTDTIMLAGIVTLAVNDVLTIYIESDEAGNTDDVVVEAANFSVFLLKES